MRRPIPRVDANYGSRDCRMSHREATVRAWLPGCSPNISTYNLPRGCEAGEAEG